MDKVREERLNWFKHVKRRYTDTLVKTSNRLAIENFKKGRGKNMQNSKHLAYIRYNLVPGCINPEFCICLP
ncbi:hypothetical protein H5410_057977 [Solanum commersonii]|uniref:Uncharacterized protein n=1 Tax=Solanum commersonii TaxID=4109 RepID=A0A9J5WPE0_SOLCO|nr:hypothetical protein H5410_057977 [Solanum commersonii]